MTVIPEDRVQQYREAMDREKDAGKAYLLAVWETGHAFRAHSHSVAEIAESVGRSTEWVYQRLRLAQDFTKRQLGALIDKHDITTLIQLMHVAYGRQSTQERDQKLITLPRAMVAEASVIGLDLRDELQWFLGLMATAGTWWQLAPPGPPELGPGPAGGSVGLGVPADPLEPDKNAN